MKTKDKNFKKVILVAFSLIFILTIFRIINVIGTNLLVFGIMGVVSITSFIIMGNIEKTLMFLLMLSSSLSIEKSFNRTDASFNGTSPSYFSINLIHVIAICFFIITIIYLINFRSKINKVKIKEIRKICIYTFIFIAYSAINIYFAGRRDLAFYEFLRLSSLLIIFMYISIRGKYRKEKEFYFNILGITIIFQLVLGLMQKLNGGSLGLGIIGEVKSVFRLGGGGYEQGLSGTFAHPSILALYNLFVFTIILYCMKHSYRKIIYIIVSVVTIILCASRTAMGLCIITYLGYIFLNREYIILKFKKLYSKNKIKVIILTTSCVIILFSVFGSLFINIANRFFNSDLIFQAENRVNHWKLACELIKEKPLTGYGLNNYTSTKTKYSANWIQLDGSTYKGGSYVQTTNPGSSFTLDYIGKEISINAISWNIGGKADVYIDNNLVDTIDFYSNKFSKGEVFNYKTPLPLKSSKHTLKIVVRKDKNKNSKGRGVGFDYIEIKDESLTMRIDNTLETIKYTPEKVINYFYLENPVHNAYLLYFTEGGIFALILFLYINIINIRKSIKLIKSRLKYERKLGYAVFSIMMVYLIYNITGWAGVRGQVYLIFFIVSGFLSNVVIESAGNKDEV